MSLPMLPVEHITRRGALKIWMVSPSAGPFEHYVCLQFHQAQHKHKRSVELWSTSFNEGREKIPLGKTWWYNHQTIPRLQRETIMSILSL